MNAFPRTSFFIRFAVATALVLGALTTPLYAAPQGLYQAHNLVSDQAGQADHTDPNLVNAWGIVFGPNTPVWIANNGTGTSTLYDGNGVAFLPPPFPQLVVSIPLSATDPSHGNPTGIVFNNNNTGNSPDFVLKGTMASALFIFASESGVISAWAPTVDFTHALVQASTADAIYKGLAIGGNGSAHFLYATDFHNNKIDVFDKNFLPATLGNFLDPKIPANFAPFGIQNINGDLYVTYAQQDANKEDDVHGKGLGYVSVFDSNGNFLRRLISKGGLNAPWGLALAPAGFGGVGGRLLVGNFGDGWIRAYDLATGKPIGRLEQAKGKPLTIDGLWGLSFGNGVLSQPADTLFFTAGPADETHGLYGRIEPVQ